MKPLILDGTNEFPLHRVERLNWILSILLSLGAAYFCPLYIAKSVVIGGVLANISYLFLKKDLINFLQGKTLLSGNIKKAKSIFYMKYYARLAMIALILYALVSRGVAHPLGLLVGLSVVVLSIGVTVTTVIKKFYFTASEA